MTTVTKDKLIADTQVVIADAEELLRETAGQVGEKAERTRARMTERLSSAKASLADLRAKTVERVEQGKQKTDAYVRANPWRAAGVAAGFGLVAGFLIGRR